MLGVWFYIFLLLSTFNDSDESVSQDSGVLYVAEDDSHCQNDGTMNDVIRKAFLDEHNTLRSMLAQGLARVGKDGLKFKTALKMPRLVYSCSLEDMARERASSCHSDNIMDDFYLSGSSMLWENSYSDNRGILQDSSKTARATVQEWWDEVSHGEGINLNRSFYYNERHISSFSKIATDTTTQVGCYIFHCSSSVKVTCYYRSPLEYSKMQLYSIGPTCKGCPGGAEYCEEGLCTAAATSSQTVRN